MQKLMLKKVHFQFLLLFYFSIFSVSVIAEEEFLPPEKAFAIEAGKISDDGQSILVNWKIADGYYIYRNKVSFISKDDSLTLGDAELSQSETKIDPYFGEIQIYKKNLTAKVPFKSSLKAGESFSLIAKSQGCASGGICYPPLKQTLMLVQAETIVQPQPIKPPSSSVIPAGLNDLTTMGNTEMPEDDFLDSEEAFKFSLSVNNSEAGKNQLSAIWSIADHHYLYKDKLKFELINSEGFVLDLPILPEGKQKNDEYLGDYEAYYKDLVINLPIKGNGDTSKPLIIKATYQGCSESGICYPKVKKNIELDISNFTFQTIALKSSVQTDSIANKTSTDDSLQSEQDVLAGLLSSENTFLALITFFLIGLGLAFTPCVFPMIPILSGIIAGQGDKASSSAFVMSVVYVLSMAVVYTLVGVVAGLSGKNIQVIFQDPWVLSSFALIFVLLSLSMFGFYNLQLPSSLQSKLSEFSNKQQGGTLIGVAIMGVLSALIVGPCMAPPLMGILLFIGQTGDPILGGSALFVMSLGMGIPLVIIGTSAGKLMPRAGVWMDTVKAVFGVSMLAVAIWMMERVLPGIIIVWLWAILLLTSGVYMGALTPIHDNTTGWARLWKSLGLILMLYASILIIGASSGQDDYFQPLKTSFSYATTINGEPLKTQHVTFEPIKSLADLDQKLTLARQQNKMLMLDFYADWCVYCKKMESTTFQSDNVISALDNFIVLQADVTEMDAEDEALLKAYKIPAPPAILFFKPHTGEAKNFRLVGYKNAEDFTQHVQRFVK